MSNRNTKASLRFFAASVALLLALAGCGGGGSGAPIPGGTTGGGTTGTTCTALAVPSAPTVYNTVPGNGSMQVWFSMSVSSGAPVISYIVTAVPLTGGPSVTTTVLATTNSTYIANVSGLTNGTAYTFSVVGVNCLGVSLPSNLVVATPATVPDAPTIGAVTPGNGQATVNFTAPASDGGSAILYYTATSNPGGIQVQGTAANPPNPITVTGLTNGTSYTFTVTATNSMGTSLPSAPSSAVVPSTVPGAPTNVVALAGNLQATVSFLPPANNGGATVSSYTVTPSPSGTPVTAAATSTSITVGNLVNGSAYTFTVTANNIDGSSVASAPSNSVIPLSNPGPYYVNPTNGADTNPGTLSLPFKTLTYALKVAAGFGTTNTINALAGTYNTASGETFPLLMVDKVTLAGAGSGTTMISGGGNYSLFGVARNTTLVFPPAVTSTVSGFTITGGTTAIAIMDTATAATLANNILNSGATTGVDGLYIVATASATLTANTISGTCSGWGWGAVSLWGGASKLYGRSNSLSETCNPAVYVFSDGTATNSSTVDLGTSTSTGGNTILGGTSIGGNGVGMYIVGNTNVVNASGNTWRKNTQGANNFGQYLVGTFINSATAVVTGNNYAIQPGSNGTASAGLQF